MAELNKGGRPSKLTADLCDLAESYIAEKKDTELPSNVGLAIYLDISEKTLNNWANIDPATSLSKRFLRTLEDVKTYQQYQAVNKGLTGEYNSVITKLVLANHGYAEKVNSDITSAGNEIVFINDVPRPTHANAD